MSKVRDTPLHGTDEEALGRCPVAGLELKIPPPLVTLTVGGAMALLARAAPALDFDFAGRRGVAIAFAAGGAAIAGSGIASFARARTTVNPHSPQNSSAIVTSGVYRVTRNPMYLGLLVGLSGWSLWLANGLTIVALPGFVLYIERFQIAPEERVLAARFGASYNSYKKAVRRWL